MNCRFLLISWVFLSSLLYPLDALFAGENARFSRVDLGDGLSHKSVYAIHQDRLGYMWFGTQNGLNRFDGVRFKVYHQQPAVPDSLSGDNINSIVEDDAGNLWLGTWGGGMNRFDPRTETAVHFRNDPDDINSLSSDYVQCIMEGKNGILWIGTLDGGLNRFDRKTFEIIRFLPDANDPLSLNHYRVWSVFEQEDGLVWVATEQGLNLLDPRKGRFLPIGTQDNEVSLDRLPIRVMLSRGEDRLWLGSGDGLFSLDLKTRKLVRYPTVTGWGEGLRDVVVNALYETSSGDLWVGTLYNGLMRMDANTGEVRPYKYDPRDPLSLSGNDVRAMHMDRSSNLWVGTRGSGISKLDLKPGKFTTFKHKPGDTNSLPFGDIRSLTTDNQGNLWVGTLTSGLTRMDRTRTQYKHYRHKPDDPKSLTHNNITALGFDEQENLLVGTFEGLNRLEANGEEFTRFLPSPNDPSSLPHERVMALLTDSANRIWVGTHLGVSIFNGESFHNFSHNPDNRNTLGPGRVYTIYEDLSRSIWVGMGHSGLYRYMEDDESFEPFHLRPNAPPALRNNTVVTFFDSGPLLWIGTMGGGLVSMDHAGENFQSFSRKDGLLNNIVYGILPGSHGTLWMSTNKGLCRFDTGKNTFRCYGVFDGLQSSQFSMGSYHRNPDGELFFGGIEGLNVFKPEEVQDHYYIPTIVISSFKVDDIETHRDLANGMELVVDPPQQTVVFDYAALDYTRPSKNTFEYKLEGIDGDWVKAGTRTSAVYHALEPGTYEFKVKGSNHDGIWNTHGTSLKITVTSSFFKVWFYYIVYGAAALFAILGLVALLKYRQLNRAKMRALENSEKMAVEANRTKSAFLAHVSHELRTPLNAIIGFTELIEEDLNDYNPDHFRPGQCLDDLAKIKSSAYLQLAQVNNLLELTRLESGKSELYLETFDVRTMVNAVLHHIHPMLKKTNNTLEVRFAPESIGQMTADFMKIQGILINLLSNANKFTKNGLINLTVTRSHERGDSHVTFQVQDSGCGMSDEQMTNIFEGFTMADASEDHQMSGLGLYITRHFSQMMGGQVGVESQVGEGSTFRVKIPSNVRNDQLYTR